jgi:hypothetical protein
MLKEAQQNGIRIVRMFVELYIDGFGILIIRAIRLMGFTSLSEINRAV